MYPFFLLWQRHPRVAAVLHLGLALALVSASMILWSMKDPTARAPAILFTLVALVITAQLIWSSIDASRRHWGPELPNQPPKGPKA
jgi:hypothetical protein